jgi:hypothetical protein
MVNKEVKVENVQIDLELSEIVLRIIQEYKISVLYNEIKRCVTTNGIQQAIEIFFRTEHIKHQSVWYDAAGCLVVAMAFDDNGDIIITSLFS